jgi:hypothetical protein
VFLVYLHQGFVLLATQEGVGLLNRFRLFVRIAGTDVIGLFVISFSFCIFACVHFVVGDLYLTSFVVTM